MTEPDNNQNQPADHVSEEHRVEVTETVEKDAEPTPAPVEETVTETETSQTVTETTPASE